MIYIKQEYMKPYNFVQIVHLRLEYLIYKFVRELLRSNVHNSQVSGHKITINELTCF